MRTLLILPVDQPNVTLVIWHRLPRHKRSFLRLLLQYGPHDSCEAIATLCLAQQHCPVPTLSASILVYTTIIAQSLMTSIALDLDIYLILSFQVATPDPTRLLPVTMSFYQAEDYKDDNEGSIDDWQNYHAVPQSTQSGQPGHSTEHSNYGLDNDSYPYSIIDASSQNPYSISQDMIWPTETSTSGYDSLQTPTQAMFNNMAGNLSTLSFSSSGPIQDTPFAPHTPARPIDAEEQSYRTMSARTDYSQGQYSQQVPPPAPMYDVPASQKSPTQSDRSASYNSPLIESSPYAQSDGYFQVSPPRIKAEDSFEYSQNHLYSVPGTPSYGYPSYVDPLDICSQATSSSAPAQLARSASDHVKLEVKQEFEVNLSQAARSTERLVAGVPGASDTGRRDEAKGRFKRGFTTVENSTCQCEVCGRLFQRMYNLKAHMETHDPDREQPHACRYPGCERRFVRRTDLMRHEQSVSSE